jgi:hypothetical protein
MCNLDCIDHFSTNCLTKLINVKTLYRAAVSWVLLPCCAIVHEIELHSKNIKSCGRFSTPEGKNAGSSPKEQVHFISLKANINRSYQPHLPQLLEYGSGPYTVHTLTYFSFL